LGKKVGLGGAFGARYGTVARKRYVGIVTGMRQKHECPRCKINSVRRLSVGIWFCKRCGYKFAGGAYLPYTKLGETSRRVAGSAKPAVMEAKTEPEAEEKTGAKKRIREKVKAAKKPATRRVRKEKTGTEEKAESKRSKKARKGASKEESK
jgi:large subunit ribosomal protein L37Ae